MSLAYRTIKTAWRSRRVRWSNRRILGERSPLSRLILSEKVKLETTASHGAIYDETYFRRHLGHKIGGEEIVATLRSRFC